MRSSVPSGLWDRSRTVLAMAAGVAGHELRHRVHAGLTSSADKLGLSEVRTRIEQAKVIAESLGRLKGAFMKAGQLLSIETSDLLPPEAVDILSRFRPKRSRSTSPSSKGSSRVSSATTASDSESSGRRRPRQRASAKCTVPSSTASQSR